jgi:hypothetical protein
VGSGEALFAKTPMILWVTTNDENSLEMNGYGILP